MAPPLLTTSQSRWMLSILVLILSAIAIGSSSGVVAGGESMFSGRPGDIKGLVVIMGVGGVGALGLCRLAYLLMPKPWRLYIDRIEFAAVAMLWICWTSATMSFSAFTFGEGVCSVSISTDPDSSPHRDFQLPTCPILTFDLALLHLLSTATLALLLVILSTALSPAYQASLSDIEGVGLEASREQDDVLIMWDLAINSPPPSPRLGASLMGGERGRSYGAVEVEGEAGPSGGTTVFEAPVKKDRYETGRVLTHGLLLLVSLGVVVASALLVAQGQIITTSVFLLVVGSLSSGFAATFLLNHYQWRSNKLERERRSCYRALEVGSAACLFLLWPLAAISFTIFPSTPNRACDNPQSSVSPPDPIDSLESGKSTCLLSLTVITLSWVGAWIVFSRLLGIVFPLPEMKAKAARTAHAIGSGGEGTSLLQSGSRRPQVGYGRIVAGEAFELGDDED